MPIKPGFKSTEFYGVAIGTIAAIYLMYSSANPDGLWAQIVKGIVTVTGALGYGAGRTLLKWKQLQVEQAQAELAAAVETNKHTQSLLLGSEVK